MCHCVKLYSSLMTCSGLNLCWTGLCRALLGSEIPGWLQSAGIEDSSAWLRSTHISFWIEPFPLCEDNTIY